MSHSRTLSCALLLGTAVIAVAPLRAQLVSERVNDTTRVCTYYGSQTSPDGQTSPITAVVGLGQECPATAPYRDPAAPVPPNAALVGERTGATNRICVYSEAGLEYLITVELTLRCAVTPALLLRARTEAP